MGFPAMLVRFPVLKVDSDSQKDQFLMILVRPGIRIFGHCLILRS